MIVIDDDLEGNQALKISLAQWFDMKDLGLLGYFFGLKITSSSDGYYLSQAKYASELLTWASITDNKIVDASVKTNVKLHGTVGVLLPNATLCR